MLETSVSAQNVPENPIEKGKNINNIDPTLLLFLYEKPPRSISSHVFKLNEISEEIFRSEVRVLQRQRLQISEQTLQRFQRS